MVGDDAEIREGCKRALNWLLIVIPAKLPV